MSGRRKTISFQSPEPGFQDIQFYSRNMSMTEPLSLPKPFFQEDLQNPIQSKVNGRYLDNEQGGGPRVTETSSRTTGMMNSLSMPRDMNTNQKMV